MKSFKKIITTTFFRIVMFIILVSIMAFTYLNLYGSKYKFGILVQDYKGQIDSIPPFFAINDNVSKYSWNTPITLPNSNTRITIEHLVTVNDLDQELNPEINTNNYFMTMIQLDSGKLISVDVENWLNGEKLKESFTKLYRNDYTSKYWSVKTPLYPNKLYLEESYKAIAKLYPFPKNHGPKILGIQSFLFDKGIQNITIVYFNNNGNIESFFIQFTIQWYKHLSLWEKILTIT